MKETAYLVFGTSRHEGPDQGEDGPQEHAKGHDVPPGIPVT